MDDEAGMQAELDSVLGSLTPEEKQSLLDKMGQNGKAPPVGANGISKNGGH
jgi:hypothetical protein